MRNTLQLQHLEPLEKWQLLMRTAEPEAAIREVYLQYECATLFRAEETGDCKRNSVPVSLWSLLQGGV